jgi:hypothetical protein
MTEQFRGQMVDVLDELVEKVDQLYGEEFFFNFLNNVQRIVEIEAVEYLGISGPKTKSLGEQIGYIRSFRKLQRFRTEESLRALLDVTWLMAYGVNNDQPGKKEIDYAVSTIRQGLVLDDDFKIRRSLHKKYYGE